MLAGRIDPAPYLFLLPTLLGLGAFIYAPLLQTLRLSFYQWDLLPDAAQTFVGWQNYARLLHVPELRAAVWNTLWTSLGLLPLSVGVPLGAALLAEQVGGRWRAFYRAMIFLPVLLSPVVAAVLWRWLLDVDAGLVNLALAALGLHRIDFLQDRHWALAAIVFITGWKLVGFSTLLIAAALSGIDRQLHEAARIDGATQWQLTRAITLPLLAPLLLFLAVLTLLMGAQWSFVYVNVLTAGGPLLATTNVAYLAWDYGFNSFAEGWSAAAGVLLFVGFGAIALVGLRRSDQ